MNALNDIKQKINSWVWSTKNFVQSTSKDFYLKEKDRFNKQGSAAYEGISKLKQNMADNLSKNSTSYKNGVFDAVKYTIKQTPRVGLQLGWYASKYGLYFTNVLLNKTKVGRYAKGGVILGCIGRVSYVYGTYFQQDIEIKKVFHRIGENESDGVNAYMVSDNNSKIYGVRNSTWYGQWWSTELWTSLIENNKYHVSGYGIRIAMFGIYPNIVHAKMIK